MEVLLARENGFCFGVKKAVELTEAAAETGRPVYNLGQVVHNPKISERLSARGVKVIKDPADAPEGIVVIRAHGVPPQVRADIEARGLECIDATCSLVLRAQRFTKQLADEGYTVVLLGTPDHPEVIGLRAYAGDNYHIVESEEQWKKLSKMKRAGVVSQSTQPPWAFTAVVAHVATISQEMKVYNTVCPVTIKRQVAASELAEPELVELRGLRLAAPRVRLVRDEDDRLAAATEQVGHVVLDRQDAAQRVDDEEDHIGLCDRGLGLATHRRLDLPGLWIIKAAGVDERELAPAPVRGRVDAIAGRARDVFDDRDALADESIEQGGLSDVWTSDDRDHGPGHASYAATGSFEPSASMRSFTSIRVSIGVEHPPMSPTRSWPRSHSGRTSLAASM